MIRPKAMTKVRIITPAKYIRNVIEPLYEMKILHIVDFRKDENKDGFLDIGKPMKEADAYSRELISLRSAISRLGIKGKPAHVKSIGDAQERFAELDKPFRDDVSRLDALKAEEKQLAEEAGNPLAGLPIKRIPSCKSLAGFVGTVKSPVDKKISALAKDCLLVQAPAGRKIAIALFVPRKFADKARDILNACGFSEGRLPEMSRQEMDGRLAEARKEIAGLETSLDNFRKKNAQFLVDYEYALTQLNEKAEVTLRFASSRNAFIAAGWIPEDKAEELKQKLDGTTSGRVHVETLQSENPPTVLENPRMIDSFEFLLKLYSLPKNYEIDPTILMFITFPLFFGFMLGDVGYGIVTLAAALLLERKLPGAKPLLRIITISSMATIAFGFVFGEFFAYEFLERPLLNRVHDVYTMIFLSIGIGVVHINLGFVLGFINELKHHSVITAFFRKGSWILLQASAAVLVLGLLQKSVMLQGIGGVAALASVLMIIKAEGMKVVELPGLLSNMLSYIRLYAIGLSSVSLAAIVNKMASGLFAGGVVGIASGILLLLFGHLINLLLGLLGPFLHSVRLHYVEFFQKFYEGGGYAYNPFGLVKRR